MAEKNFVKGLNIKTKNGQYGEFLKCGINFNEFVKNQGNNGWVNFTIKKGKSGNWYGEITEYDLKKPENITNAEEIEVEDVPF